MVGLNDNSRYLYGNVHFYIDIFLQIETTMTLFGCLLLGSSTTTTTTTTTTPGEKSNHNGDGTNE